MTILNDFAIAVWPYRYGRIPQNQDFKISSKFLIGITNEISITKILKIFLGVIKGQDLSLMTILDDFAIAVWPYRYGRIPQN